MFPLFSVHAFYFLFLNRCFPSITAASVKPVSISWAACSAVVAILHVNSSDVSRKRACSMFMYIMVDSMSLCPSTVLTWIMSLVL